MTQVSGWVVCFIQVKEDIRNVLGCRCTCVTVTLHESKREREYRFSRKVEHVFRTIVIALILQTPGRKNDPYISIDADAPLRP